VEIRVRRDQHGQEAERLDRVRDRIAAAQVGDRRKHQHDPEADVGRVLDAQREPGRQQHDQADHRHTSRWDHLRELNPVLRGWGNFYRHAWGASSVLHQLDYYVWWTIYRWLMKKHRSPNVRWLQARYGQRLRPGARSTKWCDTSVTLFEMSRITVEPYRLAWERPPHYAIHRGEPGA
jgi:hypothetical protein